MSRGCADEFGGAEETLVCGRPRDPGSTRKRAVEDDMVAGTVHTAAVRVEDKG